jgi:transposase
VISYELYGQIRLLAQERGLNFAQIARELHLDEETVAKWARAKRYPLRGRSNPPRKSKLDPYKVLIQRWLERHDYTAAQIFQRLRAEEGYSGGITILTDYVRTIRRVRAPAFLTLAFAPGECAQVDWGYGGSMAIGSTRRRLSFFVLVLCYSRLCYVEFSLGEATEHFLAAHQHAFEFLGGVPAKVLLDNLKTAVLQHPSGEKPLFHPRYLDFAAHYGFEPRACNVRKPHEKGRVESGVGYVKKNFLRGLELPHGLEALNTAARRWMDQIANVRLHGETHKPPVELFALEKAHLQPLPPLPADTGVTDTVRANNRFRVRLETNRYSVPSRYASQRLVLKTFADRLCIYHDQELIATHPRSYERHRDFEHPDHPKELLQQRAQARNAKLLLSFYALCPRAEAYYRRLQERPLNPRIQVAKILALSELYGPDKVARAIEDAFEFAAFGSDYIANLLEQRERLPVQPGPLHLTRGQDLLEVELAPADLSIYEPQEPPSTPLPP